MDTKSNQLDTKGSSLHGRTNWNEGLTRCSFITFYLSLKQSSQISTSSFSFASSLRANFCIDFFSLFHSHPKQIALLDGFKLTEFTHLECIPHVLVQCFDVFFLYLFIQCQILVKMLNSSKRSRRRFSRKTRSLN